MKTKVLSFLIPCLTTLALLLIVLIILKTSYGRKISINTIQKKSVTFNPNTTYKYFYENKQSVLIDEFNIWTNEKIVYKHNDDAINSLREYHIEKDPSTTRIVALGDSFTYGLNVSTEDNWVSLLEKKLNFKQCNEKKFEVLNFGVPGYDINYAIEQSKLRVEKYKPDTYVWFIKDDDFTEPKELTLPIEHTINTSGQYSISYYMKALEILYQRFDRNKIIDNEMRDLFDYLEKNKNTSFILVVPKGKLGYPVLSLDIEKRLQTFVQFHKNITILPITIIKEDIFFPDDYHLNKTGNIKFADALSKELAKNYCK